MSVYISTVSEDVACVRVWDVYNIHIVNTMKELLETNFQMHCLNFIICHLFWLMFYTSFELCVSLLGLHVRHLRGSSKRWGFGGRNTTTHVGT